MCEIGRTIDRKGQCMGIQSSFQIRRGYTVHLVYSCGCGFGPPEVDLERLTSVHLPTKSVSGVSRRGKGSIFDNDRDGALVHASWVVTEYLEMLDFTERTKQRVQV